MGKNSQQESLQKKVLTWQGI